MEEVVIGAVSDVGGGVMWNARGLTGRVVWFVVGFGALVMAVLTAGG